MPLLSPVPANAPVPTARSRSQTRAMLKGALGGGAVALLATVAASRIDKELVKSLLAGLDALPKAASVGVMLIVILFVIFVHELGHVAGGVSVGFRFMMLVVGPLKVDRDANERIRFGFNRSLAHAGGIAALYPRDQHDLARRFGWLIAGGPMASVLLAVLGAVIAALLPSRSFGQSIAVLVAVFSTMIALATLTPMQSGYFLTDGARLNQLRMGGAAADRDAAMLWLLAANGMEAPASSWEASILERAIAPVDGSIFEMQGRSFAYMWAVAKGDLDEADRQLARAQAICVGLPTVVSASLLVERAFLDARRGVASPQQLRAYATTLESRRGMLGIPAHALLRARAAIAAALGDAASTASGIAQARTLLETSPASRTAGGRWELDRLAELEA